MELGIAGRVALVTGASRGIGRACAVELAREGARVCLVARDPGHLARALAAVEDAGGEGMTLSADLSTQEGCRDAVEGCVRELGALHILVNNAGAAREHHVADVPAELFDDALTLKLYGYLRMSQLALPLMREAGWGRIVNVAGAAGASPLPDNLPMSIANVGVLNLTRAFSDIAAPAGVTANAVCPGLTDTDRARELREERAASAGVGVEELLERMASRTPAGRMASPEEVARVVCFLASEAASFVHGTAVYMDGGARRATP